MTPAAALQNKIRLAVSQIGGRLFGVTVGKFWTGFKVGTLANGDTVLRNARIVNVGLKGMSDLSGWIPVVVTQEMVGTTVAIYLSVEVKANKDRLSPEQGAWIEVVKGHGGRAGVARSADDAIRIATENLHKVQDCGIM